VCVQLAAKVKVSKRSLPATLPPPEMMHAAMQHAVSQSGRQAPTHLTAQEQAKADEGSGWMVKAMTNAAAADGW
jgi:hypothetical protein